MSIGIPNIRNPMHEHTHLNIFIPGTLTISNRLSPLYPPVSMTHIFYFSDLPLQQSVHPDEGEGQVLFVDFWLIKMNRQSRYIVDELEWPQVVTGMMVRIWESIVQMCLVQFLKVSELCYSRNIYIYVYICIYIYIFMYTYIYIHTYIYI